MASRGTGGGRKTPDAERWPTAEENALWRHAMRGTAPHRRGQGIPHSTQSGPPSSTRGRPVASAGPVSTRAPIAAPGPPPGVGLDRRSAQRLRRGRVTIDGRLDLHGMTLDEAHGALDGFLDRADRAGKRCLLVITGKGRGAEGPGGQGNDGWGGARPRGVLRNAVPRWLSVGLNRQRVLAIEPARPQHGGDGAMYVLLRRKRT